MTTPEVNDPHIPTAAEVLVPASNEVEIEGVSPQLIQFAVHIGYIHQILFGVPLIITSGKDSQHVTGSLHPQGRALDLRTRDLDAEDQLLFMTIVSYAAPKLNIRVFDERAAAGIDQSTGGHIHVEYHGA